MEPLQRLLAGEAGETDGRCLAIGVRREDALLLLSIEADGMAPSLLGCSRRSQGQRARHQTRVERNPQELEVPWLESGPLSGREDRLAIGAPEGLSEGLGQFQKRPTTPEVAG
jgi:hypothetical protein